jgi:hypothetical protein
MFIQAQPIMALQRQATAPGSAENGPSRRYENIYVGSLCAEPISHSHAKFTHPRGLERNVKRVGGLKRDGSAYAPDLSWRYCIQIY